MALLSSPLHIISSIPPATRAFTATLVGFSTLAFYLQFTASPWTNPDPNIPVGNLHYLTTYPGFVLWTPWTVVTAGFVERDIFGFLVSLIFLPASLRYLERLWGAVETIKFILIVLTVSNIVSVAVNWLVWFVFGFESYLYGMDYHGTMALQTGILVAFTQVIPEHQVQFFKSFSVRVKNLPMAYVTLSTVLCFIGYQSPWFLIQIGWLAAWAYLRFYKQTTDALSGIVTYGDRSETFAFVQWFPPFLHKPISIASTFAHNLAIKLKLIRPFSVTAADLENGAYAPLPMSNTQPGGSRAEAERRRAMALKALDQRLASTASRGGGGGGGPPGSSSSRPKPSNGSAPSAGAATAATGGATSAATAGAVTTTAGTGAGTGASSTAPTSSTATGGTNGSTTHTSHIGANGKNDNGSKHVDGDGK